MSIAISRRDRRVLAIGAGAIALLLLVSRGIPAWRRWDADARAGAAEFLRDEAEARTQVRILPALVDSAEARRNRLSRLAPSLLDGESAASAGATLASILTGAAARAGVRLGSVQVNADTASASTFTRVSVRADATGDLQGITEMLQSLETAPELLAVRELSITQPDAGGPPDRPESLQVDLTVQGLALLQRGQGTGNRGQRADGDSASAAAPDTAGRGGAR